MLGFGGGKWLRKSYCVLNSERKLSESVGRVKLSRCDVGHATINFGLHIPLSEFFFPIHFLAMLWSLVDERDSELNLLWIELLWNG